MVPLREGTSFGFDSTSLSLIKYPSEDGKYRSCIRVSAGTEDPQTLKRVIQAIKDGVLEIPRAFKERERFKEISNNLLGFPNA